MSKPVCIVVGVGPGLGGALVRRFATGGYAVAAVSRGQAGLDAVTNGVENCATYACDTTDGAQVADTLSRIRNEMGEPTALMYNSGSGTRGSIRDVSPEDFMATLEINALGLFHWAKDLAPAMAASQGGGVIGVTGATASLRGKPLTTAFAAGKAAQRSLAQSLAREFAPQGVHVFYAIIDGAIDLPRSRERMPDKPDAFFLGPDDIAETYWSIAGQGRSAWTFEVDLRPHIENW